MAQRSISLDIMRLIGLFCIILAHVYPPRIIFEPRNFDVPFMVIVSGFLFSLTNTSATQAINIVDYVKKRFIRLAVPVWIFLFGFFLWKYCASWFYHTKYPYNFTIISDSFMLWGGIGYVWIIRVYLMIAIFGPFFVEKLKGVSYKIPLLVFLFAVYETLWFLFNKYYNLPLKATLSETIFYLIPYLLLFSLGAYFKTFERQTIFKIIIGAFLLLLLGDMWQYNKTQTHIIFSNFKYPPRSFYVIYSVLVSMILLVNMSRYNHIRITWLRQLVGFVGASTMWIYLWHIPIVMQFNTYSPHVHWALRFLIIMLGAAVLTFLQQQLVDFLIRKLNASKNIEQLMRTIFCS